MSGWVSLILDLILIAFVGGGLVQATRLLHQLSELRSGRLEMERFVHEFAATVLRAEAGIKGLRQAARDSGDDLEKLIEKSILLRDELQFIVESADQIANRLSQNATSAVRAPEPRAEKAPEPKAAPTAETVAPLAMRKTSESPSATPSSRAERELMQALEKLG